ncbi:MAG: hypothetical protein HY652_01185 [Acidobacteria bacterium]|nr:hypothetical protein [Acidobacteriota bacterium]
MTRRAGFHFLVFGVLALASARGADFFPLEQVKPGMKAVGRTVFQGTKVEEFQAEILGVLSNIGPKQNAILARLSGETLDRTGVFAGMSGSPVYLEGKLLGAVAFGFPFSKDAIAGITPIQEMVDLFEEPEVEKRSGPRKVQLSELATPSPQVLSPPFQTPQLPVPEHVASAHPVLSRVSGQSLTPIATPLVLSGFSAQAISLFAPQLQALGLVPMQTGGSGSSSLPFEGNPTLEPGSSLSVQLVRGDMEASASGTVTHRDGNRVYAFGHQLLFMGSTDLPMNTAEVLTILPSLQSSSKVTVSRSFVGSIKQDRATGIYGVLGSQPRMIPVKIRLHTSRNAVRSYSYEMITDSFLTPFLLNFTVFNTILSSERGIGGSTIQLRGKIVLKGQADAVRIEDSFSSPSNSLAFASLAVAAPVHHLLSSGFAEVDVQDIDLDIFVSEKEREALLDRVWFNKSKVRPGETVDLAVFLVRESGEDIVRQVPVRIPEGINPGPLSLVISDGETLERADSRYEPQYFIPRDLKQLIKAINNVKKRDRLYVRLFRTGQGAIIKGEGLPDLPPSMVSIFSSRRMAGGIHPFNLVIYDEQETDSTEYVITGQRIVNLEVIP